MGGRLRSRFILRKLLTERSIAGLVVVAMFLIVISPIEWEDQPSLTDQRNVELSSDTKHSKKDIPQGAEGLKILTNFGDSVQHWQRKVRRFSLLERIINTTRTPLSPPDSSKSSMKWLLDGDPGVLPPHGVDQQGCYFFDRLDKWGLPLVHSVFADHVDGRVVITGVRRPTKDYSWHLEKFQCEFYPPGVVPSDGPRTPGNYSGLIAVPSDPMIKDEQKVGAQPQGVFIITCRLPKQLESTDVFKMNLRRMADDRPAHTNMTVCRSLPANFSSHFLSICTMLRSMDKYVPDWLEYHRQLGVERAYIYDNEQYSTLVTAPGVKSYLDSGFLTIIPWSHTYSEGKTYLETQIASENDCLWRHRHDATWMIKTDVDEFVQPMNSDMPTWLPAYLNQSFLENLAGVRLQNWFFCQYDKKLSKRLRQEVGGHGSSVFDRNLYRAREPTAINKGRDKSIVRPDRVHYFKIHAIKWGGDILTFDPREELRMVHYRGDNPRHSSFCPKVVFRDLSMLELWQQLTNTSNVQGPAI